MVDLVDKNKNNPYIIEYITQFLIINIMLVTKELLKARNMPYIVLIPISSGDYLN